MQAHTRKRGRDCAQKQGLTSSGGDGHDIYRVLLRVVPRQIDDGRRLSLEMTVQRLLERVHDGNQLCGGELRTRFIEIGLHPVHPAVKKLVLLHGICHQTSRAGRLVDVGKQVRLLIVVVGLDAFDPRLAVADEVRLVRGLLEARGLLVDAVEAADECVVAESHVGSLDGERVFLQDGPVSNEIPVPLVMGELRREIGADTHVACFELWRGDDGQRSVRVHGRRIVVGHVFEVQFYHPGIE